jgi:hypothetical protein
LDVACDPVTFVDSEGRNITANKSYYKFGVDAQGARAAITTHLLVWWTWNLAIRACLLECYSYEIPKQICHSKNQSDMPTLPERDF